MPSYERQAEPKPSLAQQVFCVVGILGLQGFLVWLDNAPIDDLLVAVAMLGLLFAAWVAHRITRRRR